MCNIVNGTTAIMKCDPDFIDPLKNVVNCSHSVQINYGVKFVDARPMISFST